MCRAVCVVQMLALKSKVMKAVVTMSSVLWPAPNMPFVVPVGIPDCDHYGTPKDAAANRVMPLHMGVLFGRYHVWYMLRGTKGKTAH